ncbi:hypothetical protein VSX61_20055 [Brenneria populi subsp. brevivirga]|uniref:hypothetical protein n=1 Tax=Brenneria populi TaxID=1505588 RepID=UPI002E19B116|nr:hypothetical protein [Brenneria populi subsp. brevivirga]
MITARQIELMQHALGISATKREPYRNYFLAGVGHSDNADLEALVTEGMMTKRPSPAFVGGGTLYHCTSVGEIAAISALPEPPKSTRYSEYLDADSCMSFSEWLLGWKAPEVEYRSDGKCRMFRKAYDPVYGYARREIEGQWSDTKKVAKTSYKEALKASKEGLRQTITGDEV